MKATRNGLAVSVPSPKRVPRRIRPVLWTGRSLATFLLYLALLLPTQVGLPSEFGEKVEVAVAEIVVRVTGKDGRPIKDLTVEDFQVEEDGRRVKITNFEAIDRSTASATPDEAPEPTEKPSTPPADAHSVVSLPDDDDDRLFFVIYLDDVHTRVESRNRALEQLQDLLDRRQADDDRIMVVRYDRGLAVEQGWTSDAAQVYATLEEVFQRPARGQVRDQEMRSGREEILRLREMGKTLGPPDQGSECYFVDDMESIATAFATTSLAEVNASLRALGELINAMGGLPGRKAVLYVSDGLALRSGEELFGLIAQICPPTLAMGLSARGSAGVGADALAWAGDQFSAHNTLHRLTAHANGRDVTLYTLQAYGLRPPSTWLEDSNLAGPVAGVGMGAHATGESAKRLNRQDTLFSMADETGGTAIFNANDLEGPLESLEKDLDSYYVLGYAPKRRPDERDHVVKVSVSRPGVRVRHQATRRDRTGAEMAADRTLAALWYGLDHNPLRAEIRVGAPQEADGEVVHVPLILRIPLGSLVLLPDDEHAMGHLTLFLATEDAAGRKPPPLRISVPVRASLDAFLQPEGHFVHHPITIAVRRGSPHMALGIWDDVGGRYAVLYRKMAPANDG